MNRGSPDTCIRVRSDPVAPDKRKVTNQRECNNIKRAQDLVRFAPGFENPGYPIVVLLVICYRSGAFW